MGLSRLNSAYKHPNLLKHQRFAELMLAVIAIICGITITLIGLNYF